jgi:hypothetical protein
MKPFEFELTAAPIEKVSLMYVASKYQVATSKSSLDWDEIKVVIATNHGKRTDWS